MKMPNISVIIFDGKGKELLRIASRKYRRIYHWIQRDETVGSRFYLKVTYIDGGYNDGDYFDKQTLLERLSTFLEED